jgi:PRTRC genetic system ThiF family protein
LETTDIKSSEKIQQQSITQIKILKGDPLMKFHTVNSYLKNPQHPITIHLVGAGGTGSQVLAGLARIHTSLQALDHPGLHVTTFDPDEVSEANIGRQLFSTGDIGQNKANVLTTRINRFYGIGWDSAPIPYMIYWRPNIVITCVDTAKARISIGELIAKTEDRQETYAKGHYWMDFGNSQRTGQVVLGTIGDKSNNALKTITEMFDLTAIKEEDQGPSCSLAEALTKQDLFINSTLANLGCNLLWKLFREKTISQCGLYLNLDSCNVNPMKV